MAAQEARPGKLRIKLKLGNIVLGTQVVRTSGPGNSASPSSKDASGAAGGNAAKAGVVLSQARSKQAALQGYVPPTASADAIVAQLREREGFSPCAELPAWDFPTASLLEHMRNEAALARPSKRQRTSAEQAELPTSCSGPLQQRNAGHAECTARGSSQPKPSAPAAASCNATEPMLVDSSECRPQPNGSNMPLKQEPPSSGGFSSDVVAESNSNSDQTANNQVYVPTSPDQYEAQQAAGRMSGEAGPSGRAGSPLQRQAAGSCASVTAGPSVGTQTQRADFMVVPPSFLELGSLSSVAQSYNSIGPFDMQLEPSPAKYCTEQQVTDLINQARSTKHDGDAIVKKNNGVWTIKALSRYVSAALIFIEAADMMRQLRPNSNRSAGLYQQTADLLAHTAKTAEGIRGGNEVGREALRLLAERLCATCLMRQMAFSTANKSVGALAAKASKALSECQRPGTTAAGNASNGVQPSPEDSTTSSLLRTGAHAMNGHHGIGLAAPHSVPGLGAEQLNELLACARLAAKFTEYLRRSSKGFEAFLERADVCGNQQAKLVCMHLAAMCMDAGMTPSSSILQHAREVVRTLCEDLAR